jgi:hypothetical protein
MLRKESFPTFIVRITVTDYNFLPRYQLLFTGTNTVKGPLCRSGLFVAHFQGKPLLPTQVHKSRG